MAGGRSHRTAGGVDIGASALKRLTFEECRLVASEAVHAPSLCTQLLATGDVQQVWSSHTVKKHPFHNGRHSPYRQVSQQVLWLSNESLSNWHSRAARCQLG